MGLLEVRKDAIKGRCFFANRDIKKGELVLRVPSYTFVIDTESKDYLCQNCHRQPTLIEGKPLPQAGRPVLAFSCASPVSPCSHVRYCSKECSQQDFQRYHQYECEEIASWHSQKPRHWLLAQTGYVQDYTRLMLRIITRAGLESTEMPPGWTQGMAFSDVWKLCDNLQSFPIDSLNKFSRIASLLTEFALKHALKPKLPLVDDDIHQFLVSQHLSTSQLHSTLLLLICKEECNSFGVYTFAYEGAQVERQSYGVGIFPDAVFFNHSCNPSVGHVPRPFAGTGTAMLFYALKDVQAGEEVSISYLSSGNSVKQRRKLLKDIFFFNCVCDKCLAEESQDAAATPPSNCSTNAADCPEIGCRGWMVPKALARADSAVELGNNALQPSAAQPWICEGCSISKIG